jgi:transposase
MMSPLVLRTWAPKGVTPVSEQKTAMHEKVSCIGAIAVSRKRDRVRFYFRLHPNRNINTDRVLPFLGGLLRQLPGNIVVVWDGWRTHRNRKVTAFLGRHRRLRLEYFPPYAPKLNPVEYVWSHSKRNPLANHAAPNLPFLTISVREAGKSVQRKEGLLRSFVRHSKLPLRLH